MLELTDSWTLDRNRHMKIGPLFILLCLLSGCFGRNPQRALAERKPITEQEAIQLAEDFIAKNGYTDLMSLEDKSKLIREVDDPADPEEMLRDRHDTLEGHAYKVVHGSEKDRAWVILFNYNRKNEQYKSLMVDFEEYTKKYGRAVIIDQYGETLRLAHQDIGLE